MQPPSLLRLMLKPDPRHARRLDLQLNEPLSHLCTKFPELESLIVFSFMFTIVQDSRESHFPLPREVFVVHERPAGTGAGELAKTIIAVLLDRDAFPSFKRVFLLGGLSEHVASEDWQFGSDGLDYSKNI